MTKQEAKRIIKKAYEQDLVEWSGGADGSDPYWVSVDNLVEFVKYVAKEMAK